MLATDDIRIEMVNDEFKEEILHSLQKHYFKVIHCHYVK